MTAGGFRLSRTSLEEGDTLKVYVTLLPTFGTKVYWRLSGDTNQNGFSKTAGVINFKKSGSKVFKLQTAIDNISEKRKKIGIEMSTDPKFQDSTIRLNTPDTSPLYFNLLDKLDKDIITGSWVTTGGSSYRDNGRRGQYSLTVDSGDSRYDKYFLEIEIDAIVRTPYGASVNRGKFYGDTNGNNFFDKGDKFIGSVENLKAFESKSQYNTVSGPWKYTVTNETLALFASGDLSLQVEADSALFS